MAYVHHRVIVPPETEPVTLESAKLHLRLIPDDTSEDAGILAPIIVAAREYCENITGQALAIQTIAAYPGPEQRSVTLPMPPLIAVEAVTLYYEDGTEEALAPSSYTVDRIGGVVTLGRLPSGLRARHPVEITYRAGMETVPMLIRQAILLLIGHWYENRETVAVGAIAAIEVPMTVNALLKQYRTWWF